MKEQITYDIFNKVDIRLGTVISVKKNEKARKPSLVVEVDFGKEIGIKQSSAQITHYYNEENLTGKQVIAVCNFPEKNIAGVVSQVLILGSVDHPLETGTTSVCPDKIIGTFPLGFFAFNVAKRFTLFFSSSKVLNEVAPTFFKISSQ